MSMCVLVEIKKDRVCGPVLLVAFPLVISFWISEFMSTRRNSYAQFN